MALVLAYGSPRFGRWFRRSGHLWQRGGEWFSLSQRERVGVREKAWIFPEMGNDKVYTLLHPTFIPLLWNAKESDTLKRHKCRAPMSQALGLILPQP